MLVLDDRGLYTPAFSPVCSYCKHLGVGQSCAAFDLIPPEIWRGENYHEAPYVGDRGIQFQFHSEVSEDEKARLQKRKAL